MKHKVIKKQNISSHCVVCGVDNDLSLKANFYELDNNELLAICDTKEWHQSYPGRMHGGMSAAILDETIGRAITMLDEEVWGVTASLDLKYKKPVPTDCTIKVVGRITRDTRKLFEGTGEIILPNGEIAVTAKGKYMKLPVNRIIEDEDDLSREWLEAENEEDMEYIEL